MSTTEKVSDHQNPRASIGILCSFVPFFFIYESVYKNLENVEFILDFTPLPKNIPYPEWYKKRIRSFLKDQNIFFRDFEESGFTPEEFFSKYHTLVGGFYSGLIAHPCNRTKKKVRVMYGLAKDLHSFSLANTHFDLVLCPSEYVAKKMRDLCGVRAVATGDPKYDRYVLGVPVQSRVDDILAIHQGRKSVLYAPTWGNLSSEGEVLPMLVELSQKYTVFYKPHHMTAISQPEFIRDFRSLPNIHIIEDTISFMDLLRKVDVVITDNSSAIFDTIIVNKPLVLVDITLDGRFPHTGQSFHSFQRGKFRGIPTSSDSLEQLVKKEGQEIAPVVRLSPLFIEDYLLPRAMSLESAIEAANEPVFLGRQKQVLQDFSGAIDGKAGERVAYEIHNMIDHYSENIRSELEQYVDYCEERAQEGMRNMFENMKNDELDEPMISNIRGLSGTKKVKKIIELFY